MTGNAETCGLCQSVSAGTRPWEENYSTKYCATSLLRNAATALHCAVSGPVSAKPFELGTPGLFRSYPMPLIDLLRITVGASSFFDWLLDRRCAIAVGRKRAIFLLLLRLLIIFYDMPFTLELLKSVVTRPWLQRLLRDYDATAIAAYCAVRNLRGCFSLATETRLFLFVLGAFDDLTTAHHGQVLVSTGSGKQLRHVFGKGAPFFYWLP